MRLTCIDMKVGRTVPPAAAPLGWEDLRNAVAGFLYPERATRALEEEIRQHFGVRDVFLVSSGTAALVLTLRALRSLSRRSEVVLPAYTCFSVPAAVLAAGLKPVLCDITPLTFDFDHELLARTLSDDTLCVIAHHLFGVPSDVARTRALCRRRGIVVVEDAAQAMGAESSGRQLGTLGDIGIFSLGRGKNITCGSGGIIVTRSDELGAAIARHYADVRMPPAGEALKDFLEIVLMAVFIRPRLYWIPAALPFLRLGQTIFPRRIPMRRLSGLKTGMLRHWQRRLAQSNRIRCESVEYFTRRLPLHLAGGSSHPYLRLPILADTPAEKERLHARSRARGLGLSVAYPTPVNEIPEVRVVINGERFPCARRVADRLVTIPTHHLVSERDKQAITALCWKGRAS
jgi:perosamine synthetase